jgi:hypothetical protein
MSALGTMVGRYYLLRGRPVLVLARWFHVRGRKGEIRNVLLLLSDGTRVVRPFRGLRKLPKEIPPP